MKKDLALYILVNKDIEIKKGKLPSQIGHAILRYITSEKAKEDKNLEEYLKLNDDERIIVTLGCPLSRLESLEKEGYPAQRDLGLTELPPNTLTTVCYGVLDRNVYRDDRLNSSEATCEVPNWLKRLRLYK